MNFKNESFPFSRKKMSLFDSRLADTDIIDLSIGAPGPDLLSRAFELFTEMTNQAQSKSNKDQFALHFQYGPNEGSQIFLKALADFLSAQYGCPVSTESLILTCGATHGLHLAVSTLLQTTGTGGVVFVENPTYFIALDIFQDLKLKVVSYERGDLDDLAQKVRTEKSKIEHQQKFWGLVYVVPSFHNPTGLCLTEQECKNMIGIVEEHDLLMICDDVYNLLWYSTEGKEASKRLFSYKKSANIISNGSFSKVLAPGIRLGWIESNTVLVKSLKNTGVLSSGGAVNNVMSGLISQVLLNGSLSKHLMFLRKEYGLRMDSFCNILEEKLPREFSFDRPQGGYFIWIRGPITTFDVDTFMRTSSAVRILPGHKASSSKYKTWSNAFRVSIAYYDITTLVKSANLLCQSLKEFEV